MAKSDLDIKLRSAGAAGWATILDGQGKLQHGLENRRVVGWELAVGLWRGALIIPPAAKNNICGQQFAVINVTPTYDTNRPSARPRRGRPALEPTETITVRLPVSVMDIIRRRAEKAHMVPSVYLAERVIHHEVVRKHYRSKRK